jgi:hypothetical protein
VSIGSCGVDSVLKNVELKTVGLSNSQLAELELYPNPSNGVLNISSKLSNYLLEISDLSGRQVFKKKIESPSVRLDVSHLPAGEYLLTTRSGEFIRRDKLLITH